MNNPKFQIFESVQVMSSSGVIHSNSSVIIGAEWVELEEFDNLATRRLELVTGWIYMVDTSRNYWKEDQLRRRPPPADMTFRELMNAANNPPERLV